jgi:hypothetical protein
MSQIADGRVDVYDASDIHQIRVDKESLGKLRFSGRQKSLIQNLFPANTSRTRDLIPVFTLLANLGIRWQESRLHGLLRVI